MSLPQSSAIRVQQALDHLSSHDLSGLIAATDGLNSFLDSNAVYVLSGFRAIGESALVLDRSGKTTLIVTPAWDAERARSQCRIDRVAGVESLAAGIAAAVTAHQLDLDRSVSVGISLLGRKLVKQIGEALGQLPATADTLARDLAKIRSEEELEAAEKATWIAERGYERLLETARPGVREFELAADIYCHMKALGAEDNFLLMSASQHNLAVRAAGQRVLDIGDIILAEITPCYRGQFVQICRTAVIGTPHPVIAEKFGLLKTAMRCGQDAAIPGARVTDVTAAMNAVFEAAGYGQYCRPPYMRVRGHGLGITSSQPGDIDMQNGVVLEDGMVFVMHPNQYLPESGYLLCGETVVVSPSGARPLSVRSAELDIIQV